MLAVRRGRIKGPIDLQVATSFGDPGRVATELITGGSHRMHMEAVRQR